MTLKTIIFDAGFTLIYPDYELVFADLEPQNKPTVVEIDHAELITKKTLDREADSPVTPSFWEIFFNSLPAEKLTPAQTNNLSALIQQSRIWRRIAPDTFEALESLSQKFRLGVLSNSDGKLAGTLDNLGMGRFFVKVIDSGHLGFAKPDPRIFLEALQRLGCSAAESLYVGDIYSIDYKGAFNVGMKGVLMDKVGAYADSGLPRVSSLSQLVQWIESECLTK
jgi:putative hydrolase of the HAD superfamily